MPRKTTKPKEKEKEKGKEKNRGESEDEEPEEEEEISDDDTSEAGMESESTSSRSTGVAAKRAATQAAGKKGSKTVKKLSNFNGNESDVREWLAEVHNYCEIGGWDNEETLANMVASLKGSAATWYQGAPAATKRNWVNLVKAMKQTFQSGCDTDEVAQAIVGIKQQKGETVSRFAVRLRTAVT